MKTYRIKYYGETEIKASSEDEARKMFYAQSGHQLTDEEVAGGIDYGKTVYKKAYLEGLKKNLDEFAQAMTLRAETECRRIAERKR